MKRRTGHYCKICGQYKANEKFSGKGHANHICKACSSLPQTQKNEQMKIRQIERIDQKFNLSGEDIKKLKSFANDRCYPESAEYAAQVLEGFYERMEQLRRDQECEDEAEHRAVSFNQLPQQYQEDIRETMNIVICDFIEQFKCYPDKKTVEYLFQDIAEEMDHCLFYEEDDQEYISELQSDSLTPVYDTILRDCIKKFNQSGVEVRNPIELLTITETERLKLRRFCRDDLDSLYSFMSKPEVMYPLESGLSRSKTRKWINRQITAYEKNGTGYYAAVLKATGEIIGQIGLVKTEIQGEPVTELVWILDNTYWNNGYALEGAEACVRYAFDVLKADSLYCSIPLEDSESIKVAEKLGMKMIGEHIRLYKQKEVKQVICFLSRS